MNGIPYVRAARRWQYGIGLRKRRKRCTLSVNTLIWPTTHRIWTHMCKTTLFIRGTRTHTSQPSTNPVALACALQLLQRKIKKKYINSRFFLGRWQSRTQKLMFFFFLFVERQKPLKKSMCVCECSRWVYVLLTPFLIAVSLGLSPSIRLLLLCRLGYFSSILFCYSFRVHSSTRLSYSDHF